MKSAPTATSVDQLIYHAMRLGRHDVVRILLEEAQRRGWASARTLVASWFDGCHLQSLNVASDEDLRVQALHMAAYDGNVGLIRVLLDYRGAINGLDSQSQPPLVYALRHLNQTTSRASESHNDDHTDHSVAPSGYHRLSEVGELTSSNSNLGVEPGLRFLILNGASLETAHDGAQGLKGIAIAYVSDCTLKFTGEAALDVDSRYRLGRTWLFEALALNERSPELIAVLVESGGISNVLDRKGRSVFHAAGKGHTSSDIVSHFLAGCRVSINEADREGRSILHVAIEKGMSSNVINVFLDRGVDPCKKDFEGCTAFDYAVTSGAIDNVRLFAKRGTESGLFLRG